MNFDQASFFTGLILGFVIAGVLGNILGRIRRARGGMRAPDNPMSVRTTGTPRQVMSGAAAAFRTYLFWGFILIVFVGLLLAGLIALLLYS